MLALTRIVSTFPSVRLASHGGGLPVEVTLISQLAPGHGNPLIEDAARRQRGHASFVDALDEPSARLGAMDLEKGDRTSLYSFVVGAGGHPFHRHAGYRVFTAISGSAGVQLRFSTASQAQLDEDPSHFLRALHHIDIPPDCLFTVRFGGGTWHQFVSLQPNAAHPAMFALSCHTDELGGDLPDDVRARVLDNRADIPSLTEVLPDAVAALLAAAMTTPERIATTALSLDAPPRSLAARGCAAVRHRLGRLRAAFARRRRSRGYLADNGGGLRVVAAAAPPADSLLRTQLVDGFDHEDTFEVVVEAADAASQSASRWLAATLAGFIDNRPVGVSQMMALRNLLVRPLGLRTSPLGCPASSLLAERSSAWFERFPVLAQRRDAAERHVQVILGADDRHLVFRSCVAVRTRPDGALVISLGTRLRTRNLFGRAYFVAIDHVHRHYIAPTMLRLAVDHAVRAARADAGARSHAEVDAAADATMSQPMSTAPLLSR